MKLDHNQPKQHEQAEVQNDRPRLKQPKLITQPCAMCGGTYEVLKTEAHWRTFCHPCYLGRKAAAKKAARAAAQAAAQADSYLLEQRSPLPAVKQEPRPFNAAAAQRALDAARRHLIALCDRAGQGDEGAQVAVYGRVRSIQADQRRLWLPRVFGKTTRAKSKVTR